jgi:hypothetical protein
MSNSSVLSIMPWLPSTNPSARSPCKTAGTQRRRSVAAQKKVPGSQAYSLAATLSGKGKPGATCAPATRCMMWPAFPQAQAVPQLLVCSPHQALSAAGESVTAGCCERRSPQMSLALAPASCSRCLGSPALQAPQCDECHQPGGSSSSSSSSSSREAVVPRPGCAQPVRTMESTLHSSLRCWQRARRLVATPFRHSMLQC